MSIIWSPVAIAFAALGVWWALRRSGTLPTIRMALGVVVGWGITVLAGRYVESFAGWLQREGNAMLPGNWPMIVPALFVALFFGITALLLVSFKPGRAPDRLAEFLAVGFVLLLLLVGGSLVPALHSLGSGTIALGSVTVTHPGGFR